MTDAKREALIRLGRNIDRLTIEQARMIREQILNGDIERAMRALGGNWTEGDGEDVEQGGQAQDDARDDGKE